MRENGKELASIDLDGQTIASLGNNYFDNFKGGANLKYISRAVVEKVLTHLAKGAGISSPDNNGGICFKCKQFDGYAAPSPKHNGKILCYKCFS